MNQSEAASLFAQLSDAFEKTGSLKLYCIRWTDLPGYDDVFDSAVVAALNEGDASRMHPDEVHEWGTNAAGVECWMRIDGGGEAARYRPDWCPVDDVSVEFIGLAAPGQERGVICASYNAG